MDRRRGEDKNWYTLPLAERQRQMAEHGAVGRRYAGQVKQIISGSIGFDDWEWGVDLFADDPLEMLSAREYQVFTLLVEGIRAKEIAARLELSPKTIDTYRAGLMRKLDIHDVAGLVKFAIQRDLTSMSR